MLDAITPLLLTYDEMPNLERTFAPLSWAKRIVVIDSGSTDGTIEWLQRDPRVALFVRPFDTHARQWEFGLRETSIESDWILALDADHVLTPELVTEIRELAPAPSIEAFQARFNYCIDGKPLRGSLYPPRLVLARRAGARFEQDGHTQRLAVGGSVETLAGRIRHDDRKPRERFLRSQAAYARLEALRLLSEDHPNSIRDRLRRVGWIAPWLVPLWCLAAKGGLLDGRAGWTYAGERAIAEWVLAMEVSSILDTRRRSGS